MSYRCGICRGVTRPKVKMRRYIIYRTVRGLNGHPPRQEIACEVPLCPACAYDIDRGHATFEDLVEANRQPVAPIILELSAPAPPSQPAPKRPSVYESGEVI